LAFRRCCMAWLVRFCVLAIVIQTLCGVIKPR